METTTVMAADDRQRAWMFRRYLETLFLGTYGDKPTGFINLRGVQPGGAGIGQSFWIPMKDFHDDKERGQRVHGAWNWAERLNKDRWAIYCGVLPREQQKGGKESLSHTAWLWLDADYYKLGGPGKTWEILGKATKPDMVVSSGGGAHLYWKLAKVSEFSVDTLEGFERKLRYFQTKAVPGCDPTHNADRVLRCAGFYNTKDPGNPKLAHICTPEEMSDWSEA